MPRTFLRIAARVCRPICRWGWLLVLLFAGADVALGQPALRDPTRPSQYVAHPDHQAERQEHRFHLESILYGADRRVAVIDGHAVSRGESVAGARVLSIEPTKVILEYRGRRRSLHWQRLVQVKQQ